MFFMFLRFCLDTVVILWYTCGSYERDGVRYGRVQRVSETFQ